jgi:DnaK suppressor protein
LIWVKQPGRSGTKLEFSFSRKAPTVPTVPTSEFKALLLSQREQLLREVRERIAASGEGLGFANQSKITDDDAVADAAAQMDVAMVIRESRELQDIEAALARIAEGGYGVCADCGGEIARARLKAYPMANRCLACQEEYERLPGRAQRAGL